MAREILLHNVLEQQEGRVTRDIDIAVAVENWEAFDQLKNNLQAKGFNQHKQISHRLDYNSYAEHTYQLDIVPFGGIENPQGIIR